MNEFEKKELPFERVLFFSDAIVAIAITLLALELKVTVPDGQHLHFADLIKPWHQYLAFLLSFINISAFWNMHHRLFSYIKKMDERLKGYNMVWLFFIVTLPFASRVLSDHFSDNAAVFLYALNILLISVFQNFLWDYPAKVGFVDTMGLTAADQQRFRLLLNLDMMNGLVSLVVSFFAPVTAFVLLFFKIPLVVFGFFYMASIRRKMNGNELPGKLDND